MKFNDFIYSHKTEKKHNIYTILGFKFRLGNKRLEARFKRREKHYDVGIISFNINSDCYNFGAALHSYAFQKYLDKYGINSVIINYYPENVKNNSIYNKIYQNILDKSWGELFYNFQKMFFLLYKKWRFYSFFKKNCQITKYRYELDTLPQLKNINRFVCETDVTWSTFNKVYDRGFLCDLPNMKHKDNVAYSVDFGTGLLSAKKQKALKKYANNFKYISIRNIFKLNYIKDILQRNDIITTIDPVFLLDKKEYEQIAKKVYIPKEYILVYNCMENHPIMLQKAYQYAKKYSLDVKVINCYSKNIINISESNPTPIGIEEFLGLISGCKYLFTNSYHGICFSIIFEKPFAAFDRIANNEKILTILNLVDLQNRYVGNVVPEEEINYKKVQEKLLRHKNIAEAFILKSIIAGKEDK